MFGRSNSTRITPVYHLTMTRVQVDLILRSFNDKSIRQRADGWISLTDMATAGGKLFADWNRLRATKDFLAYAESIMGFPIIDGQAGNPNGSELGGTWGHPKVAIKFAAWVSIPFEFQVVSWVEELLTTGSVNIGPKPIALPPSDIRVSNLVSSLEKLGIDPGNPRFKQGLQDLAGDILGLTSPTLPASSEKWCGVAERAEQLGHPVALVLKHRSQLGKVVKAQIDENDRKSEERLCNGSQRPIQVYRISEALDAAIESFFAIKAVA
ncbi:MAG: KilA-N domain-containing protein [Fusobacteriaceae bacterium]